jgi:hypothetical protein
VAIEPATAALPVVATDRETDPALICSFTRSAYGLVVLGRVGMSNRAGQLGPLSLGH